MNSFFSNRPQSIQAIGLGILIFVLILCFSFYLLLNALASDWYCESAIRVESIDKVAYTLTIDKESNYRYYESNDGGLTWQEMVKLPPSLDNEWSLSNIKSNSICHPNAEKLCYRITILEREEVGPEYLSKLEQTTDGGETWQEVVLPFPLQSQASCPDHYPQDLTFVELEEDKYNLIVAVSSGGVLTLSSGGKWLRNDVSVMEKNSK